MQPSASKTYNQLNAGVNSEQSELNLQDGFTVDELNWELLQDGSRRRRRGLRQEASAGTFTTTTNSGATFVSQTYKWRNAGGSPTTHFIVAKIGSELYFIPDQDGGSGSVHSQSINLNSFQINQQASYTAFDHFDFTSGRGVLYVSSERCYPTAITYDPTLDSFTTEQLEIRIRDYDGIDDDTISLDTQPASGQAGSATISDIETDFPDHYYNLLNRGWNADQIISYENNVTGTARYPNKQQYFFDAYKRVADESTAATVEQDGTLTFDADKLDNEIYGGTSAPQGSMLINVFDDSYGFKESNLAPSLGTVDVVGANFAATDGTNKWTIRVTDAGHSVAVNDVVSWRVAPIMAQSTSDPEYVSLAPGGTTVCTAISAGVYWEFEVEDYNDLLGWNAATVVITFGQYYGTAYAARSNSTGPLAYGPRAIEFHGGRVFYAGIDDSTWSDYVFFSQVIRSSGSENAIRCHTAADPTAPQFNAPVATDGGYFTIPNMGSVKKMLSLQDSLLIFTDQGVWEVAGRGTFFDPTQYNVRKLTGAECGSPAGVCEVEGTVIYTGPKGVYNIAQDQYTRQLVATNISDERIRTFWNQITDTYEPYLQTFYDDAQKRVYILQGGTANMDTTAAGMVINDVGVGQFSVMWIYDLRLNAWYKYGFNTDTNTNAIITAYAITGQDSSNSTKKMKFIVQKSTTSATVCDFSHSSGTGFQDYDGNTVRGYMYTAWDNPSGPNKFAQAPIVTVYAKDVNTGWTQSGNGWIEDNPSSILMQARWDWSDDSVTGKLTSEVEVYRKKRAFVPSGASDVEGYPVVVTRNKVRGRGRAFQLRFRSSVDASGEDAHLIGYTVVYKGTRKQ